MGKSYQTALWDDLGKSSQPQDFFLRKGLALERILPNYQPPLTVKLHLLPTFSACMRVCVRVCLRVR